MRYECKYCQRKQEMDHIVGCVWQGYSFFFVWQGRQYWCVPDASCMNHERKTGAGTRQERCPYCESAQVYYRPKKKHYHCRKCGKFFKKPIMARGGT